MTPINALHSRGGRSFARRAHGPAERRWAVAVMDFVMMSLGHPSRDREGRGDGSPHGLDFVGFEAVFDGPVVTWEDAREAYGEQRINLLGWLEGIVVHMTYTERGDDPHIISLRKAEKHEIRRYAKETTGYSR